MVQPLTPGAMLFKELSRRVDTDGWIEFCQYLYSLNPNSIRDFLRATNSLYESNSGTTAMRDRIRVVMTWIHAAGSIPIVEYLIEKELADVLSKTPLPDPDVLIGDFYQLPYPVVAIRVVGEVKSNYMVFMRDEDHLFVLNDGGQNRVSCFPLIDTVGSVLTGVDSTDEGVMFVIGILTYLTHGKDIQEDTQPQRGSKKKYRNRQPIQIIKGVVGGIFMSALRRWHKTVDGGGDGTHASPKPHCRAGHWQRYWTGQGRTIKRMVFVHPCLVNAIDVEEGTIIQRSVL